jgi:hypothetical protein
MLLKTQTPRTLFRFALSSLALFGLLGMLHPAGRVAEGAIDGARGALIGATVALLYLATRAQRQ